jgi:chemotaxis signal transduction protein
MSEDCSILYCEVGSERYALRSRDVRHVERAEHLRPSGIGDGRAGEMKMGDHAVPVFSLARVLGRPMARPAKTDDHIAVTGDRHHLIGLLVDRVVRTDHVTTADIAPLPALIGSPATTWFDGFLGMTEFDSAPVLSPQFLNPLAPAARPRPEPAAIEPSTPAPAGEPVAVVFSTDALPPSAARRYALSGRQIAAIVQPVPPLPLAGCAEHVTGITWWRRSIVPVIDFRDPQDRTGDRHSRRLIVQCGTRHGGAMVALSIDPEIVMCRPEAAHRQLRDVPCPSFAFGIFDVNGESVALLDLDVLLDTDASGLRDGDPVLPDLLIEGAAGHAEALGGPLDPPAFGV